MFCNLSSVFSYSHQLACWLLAGVPCRVLFLCYLPQEWLLSSTGAAAIFPSFLRCHSPLSSNMPSVRASPCNRQCLNSLCSHLFSCKSSVCLLPAINGLHALHSQSLVLLESKCSSPASAAAVFAKQHIDLLTAQAWFFQSKQLEQKVAKLSIESGIPSEYTIMTFRIEAVEQDKLKQKHYYKRHSRTKNEGITLIHHAELGFGNQIATLENLPPCCEADPKVPNTFAVLNKAVGCCCSFCDCFCCVYCIKTCSKMSDRCMIALTQLCSALSCFACSECCAEFCVN